MREQRPLMRGPGDRSRLWSGFSAVCVVALIGCADESARTMESKSEMTAAAPAATPPAEAMPSREEGGAAGEAVPAAMPRKIIFNAQVDLVVENMTATADALARLVKESGAYISESDSQTYSQRHRRATWKVRVPVDRFEAFLADVVRM